MTSDVKVSSEAAPHQQKSDPKPSWAITLYDGLVNLVDRSWRPLLLLSAIYFLWWLVTEQEWVQAFLVPKPAHVWEVLYQRADLIWYHTQVTLYETLVGFGLSIVLGLGLAIPIVYSRVIEKTLYPLVVFAQVIPKIAIAPLLVVWLGFGPEPKIVVAVLIAFFPIVIAGVSGLRSVDPELLDLAATMGAPPWKTFWKIRFPSSLPHLFAGLKVAATLAVVGAVVGEFVGASEGLGYLLIVANGNFDAPLLFACLFVMSFIGFALFAIIDVLEQVLLPWHSSHRITVSVTT